MQDSSQFCLKMSCSCNTFSPWVPIFEWSNKDVLSARSGAGDGDSIKEAAKLSGTAQTSISSSINFATRYVFRRLLERDGVVLRQWVGKIECMKKGENAKGLMVVCGASGTRDVQQPFPPLPGSVSPCSLSLATTDEQLEFFMERRIPAWVWFHHSNSY